MNLEDALFHYNKAIELAPERHETYNNIGNLLVICWKFSEAAEMYLKAIDKKHDDACAYSNLGRIAHYEGRIDDAIELFLKALDIQPDFRTAADSLLFVINNSDKYTPEQISNEHFRLSARCPVSADQKCNRKYNKKAKIRVGYVSPDFKSHSVGFFIEPVLRQHSKEEFEIYCYDHVSVPDETTERMKSFGSIWRPIFGMSDLEVANLVSADDIDILVDLSGYSKGNRLGVFALQPAPIQVTWLGYPNTTGLKQIDYRLTDSIADPPGMTEHLHSERLIRLPGSFLCYTPSISTPEVADLPSRPLVFCCFNNYPKLSDTILALWAKILHAVPGASLLLKNSQLGDSGVRSKLIVRFAELGTDSAQLILSGFEDNREEHLRRYGSCHIALDTFPYNGTTTTCEALWMGVPVVTLAGTSHASRVGASIMNNIGLPELVATSADQYVDIAVSLANDLVRIQDYRNRLRMRLSSSPLMDAVTFTRDLEKSYRWMLEQVRMNA
jgi:protein O-GlcNAc transferase